MCVCMCGCVLPTPNATPYDPQPQLAQHQLGGRADLKYWTTRRDQWEATGIGGVQGRQLTGPGNHSQLAGKS